jgi:integrase
VSARLRVRPSSWRNYRRSIQRVSPTLGQVEIGRLTIGQIEAEFARLMGTGLAPATVRLVRIVLGMCLGDAARDGLVSRNVAQLARAPRVSPHARSVPDPVSIRRLLAAVADEPIGPAVVLLATVGLRRGELLGLRWSDVDRNGRTLTVARQVAAARTYSEPKSARSHRTAALPSKAIAALDTLAGGADWPTDGPVIDDRGRPLEPTAFNTRFREAADRAGFPGLTPHDLRHAATSIALAAGVPPRDVAESAGHSPAVLMRTYAHVMPGSRERVAAALDGALGDD